MTILVDTGVLFADHNRRDAHHRAARRAMEEAVEGRWGTPVLTSFIYDEVVTLMLARTGRLEDATVLSDRLLGRDPYPKVFHLVHVDGPLFDRSVEVFHGHPDHGLSFTDASIVATVEERGIDAVLSLDQGFDGIVERVDPVGLS